MRNQKKDYKRKRDVQILIMIDEKERDLIHKRMNAMGISNRSAYLRKMALNGRIILVRLDSVDEMVRLLSGATDSINQIAHRVNETKNIYPADIDDLRKMYDELYAQTEEILRRLPS
ncbi:MAG: plasmid mobilization relaxosome protein MobC [Oscillospiraceae bacterium]|nr:plasmid mobilization relaxosome protein MobC [Oscillospiraceae bacterium]